MRVLHLQRCIIVLLFLSLIELTLSQNHESNPIEIQHNNNHQNDVQRKQYDLEEQFKKQAENDISEWIVQQMKHNEQQPQVQPYESAIFLLKPDVTQLYRIPVSLAQTIMIEISLLQTTKEGHIILPQNPQQQDCVQVSVMDTPQGAQFIQGNVYISRAFQIKFKDTHKYLKFTNKADHPLIVLLDIQQEQLLLEITVSDDQFALTNKKMQTILQQTKNTEVNREHIYKWQWGFYQKHQRHQTDMLGFTGAELLVIVATSIVQMYCIKNLINDELII